MKNNKKLPIKWDLSDLGKKYDDPKFKKERALHSKKIDAFAQKWKKNKNYLTDTSSLKEALDEYAELSSLSDDEGIYLFLMRQIDSSNIELSAAEKKYIEFSQGLSDKIRFFILSLATIDNTLQKKILKNKDFSEYKKLLSDIFENAKFDLSEKEERILSLKSGVSRNNWITMVDEIFSHEKREVLTMGEKSSRPKKIKTFNEILTLINAPCSRVRKSAAQALEDIFEKNSFIVEKEFNSFLEDKKINDELRGYERPDHARILSDDIDFQIVDTLVKNVNKYFSLSRDYYKIKAKMLGKGKIDYYERNIPFGKALHKDFPYEESVELVSKSMNRIDSEFAKIHKNMVETGKIDVYPKTGKTGGAFCMYHDRKAPVYIMLNYTGEIRDVTTLAHEMGHAIHGTLAKRESDIYYHTPTFMAEIASTFCETYAFDELIVGLSDNQKLSLYMQKLGDDISTIMRQIAAYNFEREIHTLFRKKGYLSYKEIGEIFKKHMKSYMGTSVLQNYGAENWWMYWSHLRNPFYVYSYASGLLIAKGMYAVLKSKTLPWDQVKEFFYTGSSKKPQEVFEKMGIDLTNGDFWVAGLEEMKIMLKEIKKLAKKLGKI